MLFSFGGNQQAPATTIFLHASMILSDGAFISVAQNMRLRCSPSITGVCDRCYTEETVVPRASNI